MFSPAVNAAPAGPTTRSSRRRPRPHSAEGSLPQPKAKRLRSAVTKETFQAPADDVVESQPAEPVQAPVTTVARRQSSTEVAAPRRELAVRSKKSKVGERGNNKGDGSVLLTANNTYTVSKLPAWPDRLHTEAGAPQHGAIYSDSGYALALTHTHAIVWPYAANIASPETFTFALPQSTRHAHEPLPLGTLTSPSASSPEPGLVVVMPTTGKITYWESITSAATLDLIRQQRNGVEGSVSGMFNGETVIKILNAESAGYMLGFSTGRLAYLSVRDGQGRPSINVQMLRSNNGPTTGGLFGSIRNALSSTAWRGDLATMKAGRVTQVGEREVVVATSKGRIQLWTLNRGGHNAVQVEFEARETLVTAIKATNSSLNDLYLESFELFDLTFMPQSNNDKNSTILILVSLGDKSRTHYFLVEAVLSPEELDIGLIQPIRSYSTPANSSATAKPRLYLPSPNVMAYIVFDKAVVVASLASTADMRSIREGRAPKNFEDVVDFRSTGSIEIVGSGLEEPHGSTTSSEDNKSRKHRAKFPATVLYVKGNGVLRIAVTNVERLRAKPQPVTAKSKMEQAVFFGSLKQNPLDFSGRAEIQFPAKAVREAAMELSHEILSSTTPFLPSVGGSMEINMQRRAAALADLAKHLQKTGADLDRLTRWALLWDAEKLAGCTEIWRLYESRLKDKPAGQKRSLLTDIVEYIHEDWKSNPVEEDGELDRVRFWFTNDTWRLEIALPWAFQCLKYRYTEGDSEPPVILELLTEVNDFMIGGLETAFEFRTTHLEAYGLEDEDLKYGVLQTGYNTLPEIWSSSVFIVDNLQRLTDFASQFIDSLRRQPAEVQFDRDIMEKVRQEIVTLVDLNCRCNKERAFWGMQQSNPQLQAIGQEIWQTHQESRATHLKALAELDLVDDAIALSEKHEVFSTLVAIILEDMSTHSFELRQPGIEEDRVQEIKARLTHLDQLLKSNFEKYGERFAFEFYNYYIGAANYGSLLDDSESYRNYITKFLRSKPEYAKLAWINEVVKEKDFDKASSFLLDIGRGREKDLWSKKVELSIGKLAHLASKAKSSTKALVLRSADADEKVAHRDLTLARIQDKAFGCVQPSISAAIDEKAELQLALEIFGKKTIKEHKALGSLLEENMNRLLSHEALDAPSLIEMLTLMGPAPEAVASGLQGQDFAMALEVLSVADFSTQEREIAERAIWRRCLIRDDWKAINNTEDKGDVEVTDELARTALFQTLRACYKERLFDDPSPLKPLSPKDVLDGHATDFDTRYQGLDASVRDALIADMKSEEDVLKRYVKTARLDKWFQETMALAKLHVEGEMKETTMSGELSIRARSQLEELENQIAEQNRAAASKLLQARPRQRPKAKYPINNVQLRLGGPAITA